MEDLNSSLYNCGHSPRTDIFQIQRDAVQADIDDLIQQIQTLQEQASESSALANEIAEQHQRLLSWAEIFDSASREEKKIVASYIMKAVTLTRDYGTQIEFNISEAQYLNGMEMG